MSKSSKFFKKLCFSTVIAGTVFSTLAIVHLEINLPSVEMLKDMQLQVPLKIYSADGKLIAEYGEKRRTPLSLEQMPKQLIDAVIATEDRRFYTHPGVDIRGIMRAVVNLVAKGNKEQGGSTITMQVARNFFLTRTKTYSRKINEILLALKIEQELTKNEILELYLNKIYFGKRAYGVAAAAEVYYGTTVDKLSLAQIAMLAGLPQAPSTINPLNSPENALKRRGHVLERMRTYEMITPAEYEDAMQQPINTTYHGRPIELHAPYIAEMVRQKVIEMYGEAAYDQGYQVTTTVDTNMQIAANQALSRAVLEYDQRHGYRGPIKTLAAGSNLLNELKDIPTVNSLIPAVVLELREQEAIALMKDGRRIVINWNGLSWVKAGAKTASEILSIGNVIYVTSQNKNEWLLTQIPLVEGAITAINPNNGAVLSLVGGFDYEKSSFNRAVQASRQPGSSFKPFIYGAALENGFTTASVLNDAPITQEDANSEEWRPQNHTKEFYGPTRLRVGLTKSMNLVSIRLLQALGIKKAIEFITNCGIPADSLPRGLSLALGTNHLSPLELATAFSVFPNTGHKIDSYFIAKIVDYQNNEIFTANPATVCENCLEGQVAADNTEIVAPRIMSAQTAYLVTSMLQDVVQHGSGKRALQLGRTDLAGKTGTTNDQVDGWYAGYNRDLVVTTWLGFDEPKSLKEYAVSTALPMWIYFMEHALRGKPNHIQVQPPGIVTVRIDPTTGLLARAGQADAIYEQFTEETAPKSVASGSNNASATSQATNQLLDVETIF
jgi:penicillin-binding protein 1A